MRQAVERKPPVRRSMPYTVCLFTILLNYELTRCLTHNVLIIFRLGQYSDAMRWIDKALPIPVLTAEVYSDGSY